MALTKIGSIGINTGIQLTGVTTTTTLKVGTGVTISSDGDGFFTGVVTATSYAGDGSALTGIAATDNVRTGILDVAGVTTHREDVNFTGANYNVAWDKSDDALEFADNAKATFGTSADLRIYHDPNGNGTNRLRSDHVVIIEKLDSEDMASFTPDGAVALFYNGSQKLETTNTGAVVSGILTATGNVNTGPALTVQGTEGVSANLYLIADDGDDNGDGWRINSNQDDNDLTISNNISGSYVDKLTLLNNGDLKIPGAATITGQNTVHTAGGLAIGYEGSHIHQIRAYGGNASNAGQLNLVTSPSDGSTSKTITLINNSGHLNVPDSQELQCGNGADLKVYHNGSHSYIDNKTGNLYIRANTDTDVGGDIHIRAQSSKSSISCYDDGAVELYHNDFKCFQTDTNGAYFYGPEGDYASLFLYADEGDDNQDKWMIKATTGGELHFLSYTSGSWENCLHLIGNGAAELYYDNNKWLETTTYGVKVAGTNTDSSPAAATLLVQHGGAPLDDKTLLTLQNGDGGSGDIGLGNNTHIDFVFKDGNENVTPQARITAHAGDGSDPNSVAKEGRGYLTFHCSNTSNNSGDENPGERLKIAYDGTLTASGTNDISDQRLKENIATISGATAKIKALTGRSFTWKSEADMPAGTHYGFIAQEVEPTIPDIVITHTGIRAFDKDDNLMEDASQLPEGGSYAKSVHTSGVVPVLVEALKEALTEIDNLKARVTTLESA